MGHCCLGAVRTVFAALVARRCPFGRPGLAPVSGLPGGLTGSGFPFCAARPGQQPGLARVIAPRCSPTAPEHRLVGTGDHQPGPYPGSRRGATTNGPAIGRSRPLTGPSSFHRPATTPPRAPRLLRVLLLDPGSPAVALRAAETGESPQAFAAGIRHALGRLADLAGHPAVRLRTAVYDALPVWRMHAFDDLLYLSAFSPAAEGHRSGMYKLAAAGDGVLHAGFRRQFEDMWHHARHLHGEGRT
jgi:hypothetical protein